MVDNVNGTPAPAALPTPNYTPRADSIMTIDDFVATTEKSAAEEKDAKTKASDTSTSEPAGDPADEGSILNNEAEPEGGQQQKKAEMTPEAQEAFNAQYAMAAEWKRTAATLADQNTKMAREIAKMQHDLAVEKHELLVGQHVLAKEKALQAGDARAVAELDRKLIELQLKSAELTKTGEAIAKAPEVKQQQRQPTNVFATLPPQQQEVTLAWAAEVDAKGAPVRPWIAAGHPQHEIACAEMAAVVRKNPGGGISTWLPELDRRMGLTTPSARTAISGAAVNKSNQKKPSLSPAERNMAAKLGLSEKDYLDGRGA